MRTIERIILLALVFSASCMADQVYRSEGKNGPVFTDQPTPNAKPVELPTTNTTPALSPASPNQDAPPVSSGYTKAQLVVPSSIPNGLAPTTVGIVTEPALRPGHTWQLALDGVVMATGSDGSYTFDQLSRGQHQLSLQVLDQSGQTVTSTSADVFVFWPTKNR